MTDLQKQIDDLKARLDEYERVPHFRQMLDAHRNHLASIETARVAAEEDKCRREQRVAAMRRTVERDPIVVVAVAPDVVDEYGRPMRRVWTPAGFDVAAPGDKFKGGQPINGFGEPTPSRHRMRRSEWLDRLAADPDLRAHVEAGRLRVDTVDADLVARGLLDGNSEFAKMYRGTTLTESYR